MGGLIEAAAMHAQSNNTHRQEPAVESCAMFALEEKGRIKTKGRIPIFV